MRPREAQPSLVSCRRSHLIHQENTPATFSRDRPGCGAEDLGLSAPSWWGRSQPTFSVLLSHHRETRQVTCLLGLHCLLCPQTGHGDVTHSPCCLGVPIPPQLSWGLQPSREEALTRVSLSLLLSLAEAFRSGEAAGAQARVCIV